MGNNLLALMGLAGFVAIAAGIWKLIRVHKANTAYVASLPPQTDEWSEALRSLGRTELVRLKSGGPVMTVRRVIDIEAARYTGYPVGVHCTYFDKVGDFNEHCFHPMQLEPVKQK